MDKNFDCPGCDRWINNEMLEANNNSCPYCGLSFNNKELVEDLKKGYICPKCGEIYSNVGCRNNSGKCKYCNSDLVKTLIDIDDLYKETCDDYIENKDKVRIAANKYGKFQFSETAYDERWKKIKTEAELRKMKSAQNNKSSSFFSTSPTQPHCPVCNSSNVEKISVGKKIKGSMLFGLFSNDAKKQMRCKDCGYKF